MHQNNNIRTDRKRETDFWSHFRRPSSHGLMETRPDIRAASVRRCGIELRPSILIHAKRLERKLESIIF